MAEQNQLTRSEARRAYNVATYGTNIPSAAAVKSQEEELRKRGIYNAAIEKGATEEEAAALVAGSGIGSVTPRLDRAAYAQQQQDRLAADVTPKKDLRVQQLIRRFKGQAPLAETPEQFTAQLAASSGYGGESALLTPSGRAKATESAIAAGLSPTEAQSQIKATTASLLKDISEKARITKGLTETPTPAYGVGVFKTAGGQAPPEAATTPTAPTKTTPVAPAKTTANAPSAPTTQTVDEETVLPQKPSELVKSLFEGVDLTREDAAEVSRPATAASSVASLLKKYDVLDKANIATIMKAVEYPQDVTRLTPIAAKLTRLTGAATRLAPAITGFSRASKPLQVIDPLLQAARYQNDEEFRQQQIEDTLAGYDKGLAYTVGRAVVKGNPLNPFANPVPVLAAAMETPLEARNILLGAKGELVAQRQALAGSERNVASLKEARQKLISDAAFAALPVEKKKEVSMAAAEVLRKLREKKANRTTAK